MTAYSTVSHPKKLTVALLLATTLIFAGCSSLPLATEVQTEENTSDISSTETMPQFNEQFALTQEPQDAVFYVSQGWTGGVGGEAVLDLPKTPNAAINYIVSKATIKSWNDLPVYYGGSEDELKTMLGKCSARVIEVSARIQIVKKSDINTSIPPDENGEQPRKTYYSVEVLELRSVKPIGPC